MSRYFLIILILLCGCLSAQVQRTIDLESAKDLALQQNPDFQSATAELAAAKWNKTNALAAFLPNLSLGGSLIYMDPARTVVSSGQQLSLNRDMRSISLNLNQPIFLGGRLYQAYKIADLSFQMSSNALTNQRHQLGSNVSEKYYQVLLMQDLLEIARAELEQATQSFELAELKYQSGMISRADLLRFEANQANKDIAVLQAETAHDLAIRDFSNYLGSRELLQPLPIEMSDSELLPFADLDAAGIVAFSRKAGSLAEEQNQSLKILQDQVEIAKRSHKIAKGSFLPTLNLVGSRQYDENGIDRYEFEASNQIMLNLSIPLLPQVGNYAASRKAYYDAQRAEYQSQSAADDIRLGIDAAITGLISNARRVKTARLSRDITQDLYDQLYERFRLNMLSTLELMDAELMLSAARMAYSQAYYDFYTARLQLMTLLGTDDPAILQDLLAN